MSEMTGVIATTPDGEPLHRGTVRFVWDALADEFFVWFDRKDGVPLHVWEQLDMGVRRRMVTNQSFAKDKRVQGFSSGRETTASPN